MKKIEVAVFDIGNVVLDFDFSILLGKVSRRTDRETREIVKWFGQSDLEREFETGHLTSQDFFSKVSDLLPDAYTFDEFVTHWNDIFSETPGTGGILSELSGVVKLLAATNTNSLHLEHIRANFPVLEVFEHLLASCEFGHRKPHPAFYKEVIRLADEAPEKILFIDDLERNVQGAVRSGMRGILFRGAEELRRRLRALELLA